MEFKLKCLKPRLQNLPNNPPQLPTVRFFSNTRPLKSRESSKLSNRSPLIQISKTNCTQRISKTNSQISRSIYNKIRDPQRIILSINLLAEGDLSLNNNESLLIESLYAVPKVKRLDPIREKLIRLFNCESKISTKKVEKSVVTCENIEWDKEDIETPSPVIKPRYLHKN